MSLALYGGGVIDNRGSISGNTYSRSKFGATIRAKTTPINVVNALTSQYRANLQSVSGMWGKTLTEPQRQAWNAFALLNPQTNVFGQISYLSGAQWFTRCAINNTNQGVSISVTPPVSGTIAAPISISAVATADPGGTLVMTWVNPALGLTDKIVFWTTPNISPGISYANNKLRATSYQTATSASTDIQADWHIRFKGIPLLQGQKIGILAFNIDGNTGVTSAGIFTSCIIT